MNENNQNNENKLVAIVDNNQIENIILLFNELLSPPSRAEFSRYHQDIGRYTLGMYYPYGEGGSDFLTYQEALNKYYQLTSNSIISLFHLLDVMVLYDEVIYDPLYSRGWKAKNWKFFESVLKPFDFGKFWSDQTISEYEIFKYELVGKSWQYFQQGYHPGDGSYGEYIKSENDDSEALNILRDGAFHYLNLARILNADYWPSPQRSVFLSEELSRYKSIKLQFKISKYIDTTINDLIYENLVPIESIATTYLIPSMGSIILKDCKNKDEIIPKTLEYRQSETAIAFRDWIKTLNHLAETGNVQSLYKEIDRLTTLFKPLKNKVHIIDGASINITWIPSLKIETDAIRKYLSLKRKEKHLVFLRKHFNKVLESANIWPHINRCFPHIFKPVNFDRWKYKG